MRRVRTVQTGAIINLKHQKAITVTTAVRSDLIVRSTELVTWDSKRIVCQDTLAYPHLARLMCCPLRGFLQPAAVLGATLEKFGSKVLQIMLAVRGHRISVREPAALLFPE